jgi:hypothetical protein
MKPPIFAHTNLDSIYPGYINFTPNEDGSVTVILRGDPKKAAASYVCGFAKDKGLHGRCTPGDENCNNYCNMAPEKGKMQPHPMPCEQVYEGQTASMTLSAEAFEKLKAGLK